MSLRILLADIAPWLYLGGIVASVVGYYAFVILVKHNVCWPYVCNW